MTDIERSFEILGIAPTDDALVVRKAWRALVRSYHPDTARTDPVGANKRLAEINVAYDAVCACSSDVVQRLRADIARRTRLAERLRQEALLRETRARARRQAERKRAREAAAASTFETDKGAEEPQQAGAEACADEGSGTGLVPQPVVGRQRSGGSAQSGGPVGLAGLVSRAEDGFRDAMKVCSLRAFTPKRSSYI